MGIMVFIVGSFNNDVALLDGTLYRTFLFFGLFVICWNSGSSNKKKNIQFRP